MKHTFSLLAVALTFGAAPYASAQQVPQLVPGGIQGNQTTNALGITSGNGGSSDGSYLELYPNASASPGTIGYIAGHNASNAAGSAHAFYVRQTPTSWQPVLNILQDRRVGIGTGAGVASRFTIGADINRVAIDQVYGTSYGTACLSFNAAKQTDGYLGMYSDGANNGGSVMWGDVSGALNFSTIGTGTYGSGTYSQWMPVSDLSVTRRLKIHADGKVQIGQQHPIVSHADYKLAVDGKLVAKSIYVTNQGWADFVFEAGYKPMALPTLERYLQQNKHLPNIPSTQEVEANGINLAEINARLLQSLEELTLHVIELNKQVQELKASKGKAADCAK